jgi:hypothetical protein
MKVSSSAIQSIEFGANDEVVITFNGGKEYTYKCVDVDGFQNDLTDVIEENESVGRFVNRAIKAELLQPVKV